MPLKSKKLGAISIIFCVLITGFMFLINNSEKVDATPDPDFTVNITSVTWGETSTTVYYDAKNIGYPKLSGLVWVKIYLFNQYNSQSSTPVWQ